MSTLRSRHNDAIDFIVMVISITPSIDALVVSDTGGKEGVDIRDEKPSNKDGINLHELNGPADWRKGGIEEGPDQRVLEIVTSLCKRDQPCPPRYGILTRHQRISAHGHEE